MWGFKQTLRTLSSKVQSLSTIGLTVAIAVGTAATAFSVARHFLFKKLPYHEPSTLAMAWEQYPGFDFENTPVRIPTYLAIKSGTPSLQESCVFRPQETVITDLGDAQLRNSLRVCSGFFKLLGVNPLMGRTFSEIEQTSDRNNVAVISEQFWDLQMNRDESAVGRTLRLDGQPVTVIGVMPNDFRFPSSTKLQGFTGISRIDIWRPIVLDRPAPTRQVRQFNHLMIVRLDPGVSRSQIASELRLVSDRLAAQYPANYEGSRIVITSIRSELFGTYEIPVALFSASVLIFVLIAALNISTQLRIDNVARRQEIATRLAMGAKPSGVIVQLLTEFAGIVLVGSIGGFILAQLTLTALVVFAPSTLPELLDVGFDWLAFAMAVLLTLFAGCILMLIPYLHSVRRDIVRDLIGFGGMRGPSPKIITSLKIMLILQVALAASLLFGAGLLARSLVQILNEDLGLNPDKVLAIEMRLGRNQWGSTNQSARFVEEIFGRLKQLTGVLEVGLINDLPLVDDRNRSDTSKYGGISGEEIIAEWRLVRGEYLQVMEIPLIEGRFISILDRSSEARVAVVNHVLADRFWPDESPIGKRIKRADASTESPWYTIVGVVGAVRHVGLDQTPSPQVYRSDFDKSIYSIMTLVVRADSENLDALLGPIRSTISIVDSEIPISRVSSMDDIVSESLADRRFGMLIAALVALVAVVLAIIGVVSFVAFSIHIQRHSIGVKLALGATEKRIVGDYLKNILAVMLIGLAISVPLGYMFARGISGMLYGIVEWDLYTQLCVWGALLVCGGLATWITSQEIASLDANRVLQSP